MNVEVGDTIIMKKTGRENMYDVVKIFGVTDSNFDDWNESMLAFYRQKPGTTIYGVVSEVDTIEPNEIKPYTVEVQLYGSRDWLDVIEVLKDVKDRIYYKIKNERELRVVHIDDINHFRFK